MPSAGAADCIRCSEANPDRVLITAANHDRMFDVIERGERVGFAWERIS